MSPLPLAAFSAVWTAAHYPCGTVLEVSGPMGDLAVTVLDHGPWGYPDRALDLSLEAFREIVGPVGIGVASVQYRVVSEP